MTGTKRGTKPRNLLKEAEAILSARRYPRVDFELDIGWAKNYDQLFRVELEVESEVHALGRISRTGRAVLVGRGGSGKTCLMIRTARRALRRGILPIFVDLKEWKSSDYESWRAWLSKRGNGSAFLLARFAQPATSFLELDFLPPTTEKLLLVDGLNEISEQVGQEVLLSLDDFASAQIQTSVLVSDRLTRRDLPTTWAVGKVLPLSPATIKKHVGGQALNKPFAALLELPFYLDASIQHPSDIALDNAQTQQEFLTRHTGLAGADLDQAASAAFSIYQRGMTRTFSLADFTEIAGDDVVGKLRSAGILEVTEHLGRFVHHLIHDSLAARHLARAPEAEWSAANLDAISFGASSFDTIVLIFEQLAPAQADTFLRRVYDWNLYAAGYALTERNPAHVGPSPEMEVVIFAMLGEKKLDQVMATSLRAGDALSISRSEHADGFRNISSLQELFASTLALDSEVPWFHAWREVFTRALGSLVSEEELAAISDDDSVMGWTWSNVLKRCNVTPEQQRSLRLMFGPDITTTVQWRIVHVLGAFPSVDNKNLLISALEPALHTNVRYGAVRSLVEMMSRSPADLREIIVDEIRARRSTLELNDIVLRELKRALMIRPAIKPPGWEEDVLRLVREFYQHADRPETRDAWRKYALDLDVLYGTA